MSLRNNYFFLILEVFLNIKLEELLAAGSIQFQGRFTHTCNNNLSGIEIVFVR